MKTFIGTRFMAPIACFALLGLALPAAAESAASSDELKRSMALQAGSQKGRGTLSSAPTPGILTVAGSGHWHRYQVGYGDVPLLSAHDAEGGQLPDGSYRFTYRHLDDALSPGNAQPSELRVKRGAASNNGVVTGAFEIRDGLVISN